MSAFKIQTNKLICCLFLIGISAYVGPLAGVTAASLYIIFVGLICLVLSKAYHSGEAKLRIEWFVLIFYFFANSLLNIPSSFIYLGLVSMSIVCMNVKLEREDYEFIFSAISIIGLVLAVSILLQVYYPQLFYSIARYWFFWASQYQSVYIAAIGSHNFSGLFTEVSLSGFYLSVSFGIIFIRLLTNYDNGKAAKKILYIVMLAIYYMALVFTRKRSMLLIVPMIAFLMYLVTIHQKSSKKRLLAYTVVGIVLVFGFNYFIDLIQNVLSRGTGKGIDLSMREQLWELALTMFKESPVFGNGLNSFDIRFNGSGIRDTYFSFAGAHNSYLQLLAETGVVGVILFFSPVFSGLFRGFKRVWKTQICNDNYIEFVSLYIIMLCLIYAVSGNPLYYPQQLFTLFLMLGAVENYEYIQCQQ